MPDPYVPHPRQEPRLPLSLTLGHLKLVFRDCADFEVRTVHPGGDLRQELHVCYLNGMAKTERLNEYVLQPLLRERSLAGLGPDLLLNVLEESVLCTQQVTPTGSMDEAALALANGSCLLLCPGGEGRGLLLPVATEEKRSILEPGNEPALKGSRESFVESLRTNTSLVRRRLRAPELRIREHTVGRQSLTPVDVVYLEHIADPAAVAQVTEKLERMDVDGVESAGDLEEYLVPAARSPFPLIADTQRPDRFCRGLLEGRVGVLCDGVPLGFLLPGTLDLFFRTGQDRAYHWMAATALRLLRYLCALTTLLLPGLYIALVTYHPEAIPVKLALSIAAAKQNVPFSTIFEVLTMLLAFEVVQEAGLRFPGPIGATVSILGGLVVGNAAVEAHIVSPAVLIAVAVAGVAGYTIPDQDLSNALRLWRFLLSVLASLGGLFGLAAGWFLLVLHLAGLNSFGVAYLAPFTAGAGDHLTQPSLIRPPLPFSKWRSGASDTDNRRNQR